MKQKKQKKTTMDFAYKNVVFRSAFICPTKSAYVHIVAFLRSHKFRFSIFTRVHTHWLFSATSSLPQNTLKVYDEYMRLVLSMNQHKNKLYYEIATERIYSATRFHRMANVKDDQINIHIKTK